MRLKTLPHMEIPYRLNIWKDVCKLEIAFTLGTLTMLWVGFVVALFLTIFSAITFFFMALGNEGGGAFLSLVATGITALASIGLLIALIVWYITNGMWLFALLPLGVFLLPIALWAFAGLRAR